MIGQEEWAIYARLLFLTVVANAAPVLGQVVLKNRLAHPLDCGWKFMDGRPLLGSSKTFRGCILAVVTSIVSAPVVGLSARTGAVIALSAMLGDSLTSFVKRRMGREPGSPAVGLDQVPESLLPLLVVQRTYDLSLAGILGTVATFLILDLVLSRYLLKGSVLSPPHC